VLSMHEVGRMLFVGLSSEWATLVPTRIWMRVEVGVALAFKDHASQRLPLVRLVCMLSPIFGLHVVVRLTV